MQGEVASEKWTVRRCNRLDGASNGCAVAFSPSGALPELASIHLLNQLNTSRQNSSNACTCLHKLFVRHLWEAHEALVADAFMPVAVKGQLPVERCALVSAIHIRRLIVGVQG